VGLKHGRVAPWKFPRGRVHPKHLSNCILIASHDFKMYGNIQKKGATEAVNGHLLL
jgi:hypothetical protein